MEKLVHTKVFADFDSALDFAVKFKAFANFRREGSIQQDAAVSSSILQYPAASSRIQECAAASSSIQQDPAAFSGIQQYAARCSSIQQDAGGNAVGAVQVISSGSDTQSERQPSEVVTAATMHICQPSEVATAATTHRMEDQSRLQQERSRQQTELEALEALEAQLSHQKAEVARLQEELTSCKQQTILKEEEHCRLKTRCFGQILKGTYQGHVSKKPRLNSATEQPFAAMAQAIETWRRNPTPTPNPMADRNPNPNPNSTEAFDQ